MEDTCQVNICLFFFYPYFTTVVQRALIIRANHATFPCLLPNKCLPAFVTGFMFPALLSRYAFSCAFLQVTCFRTLFSRLHVTHFRRRLLFSHSCRRSHASQHFDLLCDYFSFSLITLTNDKHLLASSCPALVSTTLPYSTE